MFFASIAGLIGIVLAGIIFVNLLASIVTNNVCYLTPFSPLYIRQLKDSIIKFPSNKIKNRAPYLTKNKTKLGDNNE